jgi:large subunit ribosomal protein L15
MQLNELKPAPGSRRQRKRLGRGVGSGSGKTAGRGTKGHNSRSGGGVRPGYEGGQMPIHRRLPKRGFKNLFKKTVVVVNVGDLARFDADATVDEAALRVKGLVKGRRDAVKLLANGDIDRPLTVKLNLVSAAARAKIEAAGGRIETATPGEA